MIYGTTAKILRVDLTSSTIEVEELSEDFFRLYPGGKALAGYILLTEMTAGVDPLGPENVLVLASGLLTGAPVSTTPRYVVSARSPLTMGYGESEAAGFWGPELKMAGFEAIVIKGRAEKPVFLWIKDGEAEIRSAQHLWGRLAAEVQTTIRTELGDEKIRVLQIGPAGEKMVRYAGLTNDLRHFNGRNGMGAVMGSKNLRAVALRGSNRYQKLAYDADRLKRLGRKIAQAVPKTASSWSLQEHGTPVLVEPLSKAGILPTRNFRQGEFDGVDGIKIETYESQALIGRRSCYACAVSCKREVAIDGEPSEYGGPEYETIGAFGSDCGVGDLQSVLKANELCNAYVMDTISTGATIAFAMECFERGLISLEDTGGLELRFGNAEAMLTLVEQIARREGFGDLLAEGSLRAAQKIGGDALRYAIQVKGMELALHDPRGKYNVGLGYAVAEIGADHLVVPHDPSLADPESQTFKDARALGITEAAPSRSLSDVKVQHFYILEKLTSLEKVIGFCFFGPAPRSLILPEEVQEAINAATGWDLSIEEMLQIGERATNLARLFNQREGFSRQDDVLPERMYEPLENGALQGESMSRQEVEHALSVLYRMKGWDEDSGMPTSEKLAQLNLGWAADLVD